MSKIRTRNFRTRLRNTAALPLAMFALTAVGESSALAKDHGFKVVYTFPGNPSAPDVPLATLVNDSAGNLYGTTAHGGAYGNGSVFKLTPHGAETVLYSFTGGSDGGWPDAGVLRDKAGNLYGTTMQGGADGSGVAYKLAPDGTETVLHAFTGGSDGGGPRDALIEDKKGNLYGDTCSGGNNNNGVVFKLSPKGKETVLYTFAGSGDASCPQSALLRDKAGNLYGTAGGGANGNGAVFKLAPDGTESVLFSFDFTDGNGPYASLIADSAGNFYGTTVGGGANNAGTVFELTPDGTETVLYSFQGGTNDGYQPYAGVIRDKAGNFYGTTTEGGPDNAGTVFKLAPNGTETVLHTFTSYGNGNDGSNPYFGLTVDAADEPGYLYGVTSGGGANNCGTVFTLKK